MEHFSVTGTRSYALRYAEKVNSVWAELVLNDAPMALISVYLGEIASAPTFRMVNCKISKEHKINNTVRFFVFKINTLPFL